MTQPFDATATCYTCNVADKDHLNHLTTLAP